MNTIDRYTFSPKGEQRFNELVENGDALYLCYLMEKNLQGFEAAKLSGMTEKQFDSILQGVTDLSLVQVQVEKGAEYKGCLINQLPSGDMKVKLLYGPKNSSAVEKPKPHYDGGIIPANNDEAPPHPIDTNSPEFIAMKKREAALFADSAAQQAAGGVYAGMTAEEIDPDAPVNPFAMTAEDRAKHAEAYNQVHGDEEN